MEKTETKKTSIIKKFFKKTISFIIIVSIAFYGGMYVASDRSNEDVLATVSHIIKSTEDQPIIMIIPNYSLWEKAKYLVTEPPMRKVIKIKTSAVTRMLFKTDESSWIKSTWTGTKNGTTYVWNGTKNGASSAWDGTKNGASYVWDGTKNGASYVWDGTKNGASSAWNWVTNSEEKDDRWWKFR